MVRAISRIASKILQQIYIYVYIYMYIYYINFFSVFVLPSTSTFLCLSVLKRSFSFEAVIIRPVQQDIMTVYCVPYFASRCSEWP